MFYIGTYREASKEFLCSTNRGLKEHPNSQQELNYKKSEDYLPQDSGSFERAGLEANITLHEPHAPHCRSYQITKEVHAANETYYLLEGPPVLWIHFPKAYTLWTFYSVVPFRQV